MTLSVEGDQGQRSFEADRANRWRGVNRKMLRGLEIHERKCK